jgi:hypothetical protein
MSRAALVLIASCAAVACGSKGDATLNVYTQNPTLAKSDGPFGPGTLLTGGVDLVLDEGAYSNGSVSVDSIALRLFGGADGKTAILAGAKIDPTATVTYPLVVNAGEKKTIHFTISNQDMSAPDISDLCAGPVSITGFVSQTGSTAPLRVGANAIAVSGC